MASVVITIAGEGIQLKTNDQSGKFNDSKRLCFDKRFGVEDCAGACVKIHTNISGVNKTMRLHHDNSNPNWGAVDSVAAVTTDTHAKLLDELYKLIQ